VRLSSDRVRLRLSLISLALLFVANAAFAQAAGEWKYTITTDPASVPVDMLVNFPTVSFTACRSTDDFASGRAFALQTLASSVDRCPSVDFVRESVSDGKGDRVRFTYACDQGQTLAGSGTGRVQMKRFEIQLNSRYSPPVSGVTDVKQTMSATYVGVCKVRPDADLLKTP
jgi:hypothetical protein